MFDEFKEIEWRARVEAIREKLDQQREQRQEQERAERAERQAEEEEESEQEEQAGVFAFSIEKMSPILQWNGDRLLPGEQCESHLLEFRNVLELEGTGAFRYASDYADVALKDVVDEKPGSRAIKLLMLSLDRDFAADLQGKNGAAASDDSQSDDEPIAHAHHDWMLPTAPVKGWAAIDLCCASARLSASLLEHASKRCR